MIKTVKTLHTAIWVVMVTAIFYILYCGLTNTFNIWLWSSIGLIIFEGIVLWINKGQCPLTPIAMKYTEDRNDNFDIYLPRMIAKHNKTIFTILYLIGLILVCYNIINRYF